MAETDTFAPIRPFFYVQWVEDCGQFKIAKLLHRTKGTYRIAYRMKDGSRIRMSPEVSEQFLEFLHTEAIQDRRQNGKPFGLRHRIRIFAREVMPSRWNAHRRRMRAHREKQELSALPQFGLF